MKKQNAVKLSPAEQAKMDRARAEVDRLVAHAYDLLTKEMAAKTAAFSLTLAYHRERFVDGAVVSADPRMEAERKAAAATAEAQKAIDVACAAEIGWNFKANAARKTWKFE